MSTFYETIITKHRETLTKIRERLINVQTSVIWIKNRHPETAEEVDAIVKELFDIKLDIEEATDEIV